MKYVFLSGLCKDTNSSELSFDSGFNTICYGMWVNGRERVILSLMPFVVIVTMNSEPKFELYRCYLKSSLLLESYPPWHHWLPKVDKIYGIYEVPQHKKKLRFGFITWQQLYISCLVGQCDNADYSDMFTNFLHVLDFQIPLLRSPLYVSVSH